jgi:hypothetical protein
MNDDDITIWGIRLKRLGYAGFTNAALFATVLFLLSMTIVHLTGAAVGPNNALAACFTGAIACELGLEVHRSARHFAVFLALAACVLICLRLGGLFALAAAGG